MPRLSVCRARARLPLAALVALVVGTCAAAGIACAAAGDPVFPPAARLGLAPPPDFVVSSTFLGYRHKEKQASILMMELPGYAFDAVEKQLKAEIEHAPNVAVERRDAALKNGGHGFVLSSKVSSAQGPVFKWTLVAQIRDATAVVTAIIPEAVKEVASDAAVRAALNSVTVRDVPFAEQMAVLPFTLNDLAGFRLVRVQPGFAAMLTDGAKNSIESTEQPLMIITILPGPAPEPGDRDRYAHRLFTQIPGLKDVEFQRAGPLRMINSAGHEIVADAKDAKDGGAVGAVQWLRFGSGAVMRIVAMSRKDTWEKNFQRFRALRDGIQPK
jgi:hypothetical protein